MEKRVNTEKTEKKQNAPHLFQPGQSGNPNGRPLGQKNFTTKVREALAKIAEGKDYTYEEAFLKAILKKAIVDQDVTMMRLIWNYLDGTPTQRTEITGLDGKDLIPDDGVKQNIDKVLDNYFNGRTKGN